ncbi:DUF6200 domain-containing protein [Polyangium jinanense]|uniref:Uncharacterized protein n=1 Tax=Polyangium jinanense TaxID=2829994 RepID=A0A9X4ATH6_9BACT|nr:hypothetical protein [Polyangium jinanense]MDC3955563.1 hypothetical protein [Polyangium jinanense]MDC3982205.1 hypothetical protein [Polyangium jinanense]
MATETVTNTKPAASAGSTASAAEPIVIDMGKKKRKLVKKLRRGKPNRLMDRIQEVLQEARDAKAIPAGAQPVVIVIREKKNTKYGKMWGLG